MGGGWGAMIAFWWFGGGVVGLVSCEEWFSGEELSPRSSAVCVLQARAGYVIWKAGGEVATSHRIEEPT